MVYRETNRQKRGNIPIATMLKSTLSSFAIVVFLANSAVLTAPLDGTSLSADTGTGYNSSLGKKSGSGSSGLPEKNDTTFGLVPSTNQGVNPGKDSDAQSSYPDEASHSPSIAPNGSISSATSSAGEKESSEQSPVIQPSNPAFGATNSSFPAQDGEKNRSSIPGDLGDGHEASYPAGDSGCESTSEPIAGGNEGSPRIPTEGGPYNVSSPVEGNGGLKNNSGTVVNSTTSPDSQEPYPDKDEDQSRYPDEGQTPFNPPNGTVSSASGRNADTPSSQGTLGQGSPDLQTDLGTPGSSPSIENDGTKNTSFPIGDGPDSHLGSYPSGGDGSKPTSSPLGGRGASSGQESHRGSYPSADNGNKHTSPPGGHVGSSGRDGHFASSPKSGDGLKHSSSPLSGPTGPSRSSQGSEEEVPCDSSATDADGKNPAIGKPGVSKSPVSSPWPESHTYKPVHDRDHN